MKTFKILSVAALVMSGWMPLFGQTAEVPGDNFSLEGALELFKKSSSPEEFEKLLNSPDEKVNNLDLNGDGYIDYIRVHDRFKGNVHAFTLQAVIADNQLQDIAVIELEKLSDGKAVLQIVGDEDIYGVTTIIEPTREVRTYAGAQTSRMVVNVWAWPSVRYVYGPYYDPWVSPWGWHSRPVWWSSWRPITYVHYYPIWRPYYSHYVVCHTRRVVYAYDLYRPYRTTSVIVHRRYSPSVVRYRDAHRDGYRRDDGRTYARDDRSRSGSDYQRTNEVRRTNDVNSRTASPSRSNLSIREGVTREQAPSRVRAATPEQQAVRRDDVSARPERIASPARTTAPARNSPEPQPQREVHTETPRRTEVNRTTPAPSRSREVQRQSSPSSVQRREAPQQIRSTPSPSQAPARSSGNPPTRSVNRSR